MNYRRVFVPGGTYFFTVVTYQRKPIFGDPKAVSYLRDALRTVMRAYPFKIDAAVILPDHLHMIWTLPPDDSDYPCRWRLIKSDFTHHWRTEKQPIWQRRYWEHLIRDNRDLNLHIEYIHNNPVKHHLVRSAEEWEYSSLRYFIS